MPTNENHILDLIKTHYVKGMTLNDLVTATGVKKWKLQSICKKHYVATSRYPVKGHNTESARAAQAKGQRNKIKKIENKKSTHEVFETYFENGYEIKKYPDAYAEGYIDEDMSMAVGERVEKILNAQQLKLFSASP